MISGWTRSPCGWGLIMLAVLLTSCATADLASEERRHELKPVPSEVSLKEVTRSVLQNIDPGSNYQQGRILEVTGADVWESTVIRWLTPLDENTQRFEASLKLFGQGIEFTFRNGQSAGRTLGFDGQSYRVQGSEKTYERSSRVALYLGPLQNYLEWHQTLLRNPTLTLQGVRTIRGTDYLVLLATKGSIQDLDTHDQYLVYVNSRSRRVDYVEFTLRALMDSYSGVLHYRDFQRVQDILMPFRIDIGQGLTQPDVDHTIVLDSAAFRNQADE